MFENFLFNLVKSGEITEKFDSLNKSTATKIERFVKDYIAREASWKDLDSNLKTSLKEFDSEFRKNLQILRDKQARLKQELLLEMKIASI
jgi:uncharacterized protein YdgA (DUF945 family)